MSEPIARFEDFIAWQKARELTAKVYRATEQVKFQRDYGLRDQMRRASVSIMANIAEVLKEVDPLSSISTCLWPKHLVLSCVLISTWH
jgi:23S rRNA-intervening sequence protein